MSSSPSPSPPPLVAPVPAHGDDRAAWLKPGPRPSAPSVVVTTPAYDGANDANDCWLHVEVSDPHRVGDGLSKHIEYKISYWTNNASFASESGCVTRRYSDFEWLGRQLSASVDGAIVPLVPSKTLMHMDDPSSRGIEKRRAGLAMFMARIAAHPFMRKSSDVQVFLEDSNKSSWSSRSPWYERGVLSDSVSSVTSWLSTINTSDVSASLSSSMAIDALREKPQHTEVVDYVSTLKMRLEKLVSAASALQKHGKHTVGVYQEFCACLELLAGQEDKALKVFAPTAKGVWWDKTRALFAAMTTPQQDAAEAMRIEFLEPLEDVHSLCCALMAAFDARKRVVDHYNRVTAQIERIEAKLSTMGVPEPCPKREEKQKIELAASDLRIERTQTHERYERCCANMEHELLWFHTELATALGSALKKHVAASGRAAGSQSRVQDEHFCEIKKLFANKPEAFSS